jgi:prepilin-type N-terminal cleavage/methylation domain-containing protein
MNMKKTIQNGFTLIELLVVIGVIGALLSFVTVSFSNAQKQGRDSRRRQDMVSIQNALEQYYANNNFAYPICSCTDVAGATISCCLALNSTTYFSGGAAPVDPLGVAPNRYVFASSATAYTVTATLEKTATSISIKNLQ